MTLPLHIWLVEDEPIYSQAFEQLVASSDEFVLDCTFGSAEALDRATDEPPDLVVMDLQLPGRQGAEATRRLRSRWPDVPVVVLTLVDRADAVFDALRAGASGYVVKGTRPEHIFRSLREACAGGTYFAPNVARYVLGHFEGPSPDVSLSSREVDVLAALAEGLTKSGIAERLFLSPHTVDSHLRAVYTKLHVRTAAHAAAKGVRLGVI